MIVMVTSFYRTQARSLFLFSYLLHFNCKFVVQKIRNRSKPLVLMFYGKPGIGKTEVAKQISKAIYGSSEVLREQMSMVGGANSLEYFKATGHSEDAFSKNY
ncbi:hypothetical protein EFP47_01690 [Lactiplantibacillus pentosus]|nr:hypothetical protein [Lactiplantibacillus pentosus]